MRTLFFLFLTINLMGQTPPRVTFKQLQKDTLTGSIAISGVDSNLTYSRDFYISADSFLILYGDTVGQGSLNAILVDGVTILGDGVSTNLSADTNLIKDIIGAMVNAGLGIDITYDPIDKELLIESLSVEDYVKNGTGLSIPKGTPLYVTGISGNFWEVAPADASDANKMPVVAIAGETIGAGDEGIVLIKGHIKGVNTSAFTAGDEVYVAPGGGYTNVRPKGESNLVQFLGTVVKADANGSGIINLGEVEQNLNPGRIFIGGADSTITRVTLKDSISLVIGDSLASNVVREITAGTFLSGGTITSSGTIALDTINADLKAYINANSGGGSSFNNLTETADTIFVAKYLDVDTATLYVDAINNQISIGSQGITPRRGKVQIYTDVDNNPLHITGNTTGGGIAILQNFNNSGYSGFNVFDSDDTLRASLAYGNKNAPTFANELVFSTRQPSTELVFYQGGQFPNNERLRFKSDSTIVFSQGVNPRMTIAEGGKVGIGTTTPSEVLDVDGNARFRSIGNATRQGALSYTSTGVLTTNTSDLRLKTNLQPIESVLNYIEYFKPYTFNWINDIQVNDFGFIAQDVEEIYPLLVFENQGMKGIHYDKLGVLAIKAIQEQQAIINKQQTQINELLQRIINLENK
jgi:hypothetical protein